jgi:hypothetical protein
LAERINILRCIFKAKRYVDYRKALNCEDLPVLFPQGSIVVKMNFIDLFFVLHSIAARIELERDTGRNERFVPAGKISQSSADELRDRVAPGIDLTHRVSKAAQEFNEALLNSRHPLPKLFTYDVERKVCTSPADNDAWSRMESMLLQAMFWGVRQKRYYLEHFLKATTEGEYFLRGPVDRHEPNEWLTPEGNVLQMTLLGFDSDELFSFLDVNRILYKCQPGATFRIEEI